MSRLSKNSIAAGLTTLLVTTAMSFSANGATTTTSYAEAQFVAGRNGLGEVVNVLGDGLEDGGSNACEPATDDCPAEAFTQSPLQPLEDLTIPIGDAVTGSEVGAAGNYAKAGGGASRAASGAVTEDGIVQAGGGDGAADADATLDLSAGALGDLGATDALANLTAQIGAVSSTAELTSPTATVKRDYNIAGANIILSVPALTEVADAVDEVNEADLDDVTLSSDTLCDALGGTLNVAVDGLNLGTLVETALETTGLITDGEINVCNNAVADALGSANPIEAKITGLNAVTDGLTTFTNDDGVVFDFVNGEIRFDVAAVLLSLGKDINNLPPSTDLLNAVLPALALNADDLVNNVRDNLVQDLKDNFDVELTLGGTPVPLDALNDGVRSQLLPGLQTALDGVSDGFAELGDPLADGLDQITEGLADVVQILVNVPDEYISLRSQEATLAATSEIYSQTAVEIKVLGDQAADVLLANTLVGPNSAVEAADDGNANGDGNDDADGNDNGDGNNDDADGAAATAGDGDGGGGGNGASVADGNSAADADVSASLPNTGAPNLLPFVLLGLALVAFGIAVMVNERRRLGLVDPDQLV